ncbi:alpha-1-antitrypsin-like protein CM55-ST isoform X2 [Cynoglossus semilaevis]|nr:alpha-1-antitrypsin-like protein CM55-ST isoform X2 [Cynoglossus semilaevis]
MRSTLSFWILSAVVCLGRSHHHLGHGQDTAADEDSNALSLVSSANREFAFNLYRKLSTHPESKGKNVFYSPRSVSLALAALAVGARGDTHRQLFDGLGFNSSLLQQTDVDRAFRAALRNETSSSQDTSEGTAAFLDRKFQPNPDFLQVLKESYSTEAFNVEFAKKQESLDTINGYVSGKTGGKIDKLLDSVEDDVAMYLVSYIYFKGKWKTPFDPTRTRKENFTVDENNKVLVDMMSTEEFVDIYQDLGLNTKVLHLPFNSTYSMVLLLPDNMEELEKTICPVHVTKWLKWTKPRKYELYLPKFSIKTSYDMKDALSEMGMTDMFGSSANLRGISEKAKLAVSKVVHKATLDVDEAGATAAAATGIGIMLLSFQTVPVLRFDRPFMVLIVDRTAEDVLFVGKIVNPTL